MFTFIIAQIFPLLVEVPEPPQDVAVVEVESRQATVSWTHGHHGNSPITYYVVHYGDTLGKLLKSSDSKSCNRP